MRPKAGLDLDAQAYFYAVEANPELGHRFLSAAADTFALLATQPEMGWWPRLRTPALESVRIFRVRGFEKMLILYPALPDGIEILRVLHASRNLQALLRREGLG